MSCLPSGEKRGRASSLGEVLRRRAVPPSTGTTQRCDFLVLASRSTSSAEKTTHLPSGAGTGSATRISAIISSKVKTRLPGCGEVVGEGFCAKPVAASNAVPKKVISFMFLPSRYERSLGASPRQHSSLRHAKCAYLTV